MALTKTQKEEIVAHVRSAVADAQSVVFVNFHGLGVADTNEMRGTLLERGVRYTVVKKSLLRRALGESKIAGEVPTLDGEIAIAYLPARGTQAGGDDPVAPASGIAGFIKKHKEQLTILGGIFEGAFADREKMETIAAIPPMPTLRGMFVNVINSPIAGLAVALSAIAEKKEAA